MTSRSINAVVNAILAFSIVVKAISLPYTPTRILLSQPDDNATAWIFSPQSSSTQSQLSKLDLSNTLSASSASASVICASLPFLDGADSTGYTPVINDNGTIVVTAGNCVEGSGGSNMWQFVPDENKNNGTWSKASLQVDNIINGAAPIYGSNFLSAGVIYPANADASNSAFYFFGGMCPEPGSNGGVSTWTSSASYSDTMLVVSPASGSSINSEVDAYHLTQSTARGGPIAEAGLTMTPLSPTFANESSGEGQNFVLIGGHTAEAFINMSQVALFSLPEQSWSFISVTQPPENTQTELAVRVSDSTATVEPRSGHTALLSPAGDRIIVLGGWVGDVNTPATPQLAILELGSGYGGTGDWSWTVPSTMSSPFSDGQGIYGHGAAMLPGGVMLIMGGYSMSASPSRFKSRQSDVTPTANNNVYLFNITSETWISSYTNPSASSTSPSPLSAVKSGGLTSTSQKAGVGAGVALGCSTIAGLLALYLWYSRRLRRRREAREKELYDLAVNATRYQTETLDGPPRNPEPCPEMQVVGTVKRKPVPNSHNPYPWAPVSVVPHGQADGEEMGSGEREAERTGLLVEIPSPTRGLRRNLQGRQPPAATFGSVGRSGIHTIDERAEYEESNSARRQNIEGSSGPVPNRLSDPFKDPPPQLGPMPPSLNRTPSEVKRQRMAEIQGWVDDWTAAAAAMEISRKASTTSGSQSHSHSHSHSNSHSTSGRGSPDKSDRTGSNLSDASMFSSVSNQKSNAGTLRREGSTRSVSAGYAQQLFHGAAAAVNKLYSTPSGPALPHDDAGSSTLVTPGGSRRATSLTMRNPPTFSSQVTTTRPATADAERHPEAEPFLKSYNKNITSNARPEGFFFTPPESPIKERPSNPYAYSSLLPSNTSTDFGPSTSLYPRRGALGFLGSVKRALTGTSIPNYGPSSTTHGSNISAVKKRVQEYESRSSASSPTKRYQPSPTKEMADISSQQEQPQRSASAHAAFWRGRKGRKDWSDPTIRPVNDSTTTNINLERKPSNGTDEDEWDVERAIQNRLVQVMFTVPKEKLRVVNANERDRLSISDVDFEGGENSNGVDVRDRDKGDEGGKGKAREDVDGGATRRLQTF